MKKHNAPPVTASLDYYKLTMGNVIFEQHPDADVTFTLKNRNSEQPLGQYVSAEKLSDRLDTLRTTGFQPDEIAYLGGIESQNGNAVFTQDYLDYLTTLELPHVTIEEDTTTQELSVYSKGAWPNVSLWETVVMSEVNEMYYENLLEDKDLTLEDIYAEGDRRLDQKIALLSQHPDIQFADFGTRRRFSLGWHEHVIARLKSELPAQFTGTSNPYFAYKYDLTPIGTFAHEMPMVYSALEDKRTGAPLDGHSRMLNDWETHYKGDLSIALTDTFGSDFFFEDFTGEQAAQWNGFRHDSGDPVEFGEKAIAFYLTHGTDPATKTIVFSDGLDVDTIIELHNHFDRKIRVMFGWGTSLMNDLGLPANNFVMKATSVDGAPTVKLSDDTGKHTGPEEYIARYQQDVAKKIGRYALT